MSSRTNRRLIGALLTLALAALFLPFFSKAGAQTTPDKEALSTGGGNAFAASGVPDSATAAAPQIDAISPNPAARSGIIRISGASFGATGQLRIDGKVPPLVQYWSDNLIIAHVPEDATLGNVTVEVNAAGGMFTATLDVTPRQSSGRIRWRADLAGDYSLNRVAVAPPGVPGAGTVYVATNADYLYAFNPDGGIKWVVAGADGDTQTSVGPDGTIYTGTFRRETDGTASPGVAAWNPDGTQKWIFADRNSQSVRAGPNVGPDGKIYVIFRPLVDGSNNFIGVNFAALRPDGSLAWSVNRGFYRYGQTIAKELAFGKTLPQVYFTFDVTPDPDPTFVNGGLFAYNFDGKLVWQRGGICCGVPTVAPDDNLALGGARLNARNGGDIFVFDFPPYGRANTDGMQDVGPDNIQYAKNSGRLWAINPNGTERWRYEPLNADGSFVILGSPVVNRQNSTILFGGGGIYQESVFLAVAPQTGQEQWRQMLPREPGYEPHGNVYLASRATYSADGQTGYLTGDINGDQEWVFQQKRMFLYALNTGAEDVTVNQQPQVSMTNPAGWTEYPKNTTVNLTATATDDQPVAGVEFYVQRSWEEPEQLIATDTEAPYSASYKLSGAGGYMLIARVRDAGGLVGESRVGVTVTNVLPSVNWVSPADGVHVAAGSSLTLVASASDADGTVQEVNFYSDALLGKDTAPDAQGRYETVWSNIPAGTHSVQAQAIDDNGSESRSIITVVADATPTPTPTPTPATPAQTADGLQYYPLAHPVRLLDTRPGEPACNAPGKQISANSSLTQAATGTCGGVVIPSAAKAVVGNAAVVNNGPGAGAGYLTVYPGGTPRPVAANVNYAPGDIVSNAFTVALGADGAFNVYSYSTAHVVIDVTGYYAPPGQGGLYYHPLPKPVRLLDTRAGEPACDSPATPIPANSSRTESARVTCSGVTLPVDALAVAGNAAVVNTSQGSSAGHVTLYPGGVAKPVAANVNYKPGDIVSNAFTVGLSADGKFQIYAYSATDIVVDVTGYYSPSAGADSNGSAGLLFRPLSAPVRLLDTRPGEPACSTPGAQISADTSRTQAAAGTCGGVVIPATAKAVVGNAAVVNNGPSAGAGYVTVYPSGVQRPVAANVNYAPGQIVSNAYTVGLGADGGFQIYAYSSLHFVADVSGYFAP